MNPAHAIAKFADHYPITEVMLVLALVLVVAALYWRKR